MANPYPTPSIYTYRVTRVAPASPGVYGGYTQLGYYLAEFSKDNGVTFNQAFSTVFQSAQEALQAISILVGVEVAFASQVNSGQIPVTTHIAYPAGV